ncbi:uncharacterized protein LOC132728620 isoform X1 [Ruditapes philippinarum]|uniref:uncharacterized protein LOC132728620 isoform X1 n=1 Tax=Ruditapes philippinarum TaxID=129788 RepID=UPI00295B2405|nr:uncharacterized protein LOC132728620 isoform X1 [Ruditapes philippinarum]
MPFGQEIRREFMLRDGSVFLNHGAYGCIPRCVHDRQISYLAEIETHPDIWFRYKVKKYIQLARNKVAGFMGINTDDIYLLTNVTKAINTVLKSFPLCKSNAILLTSLSYYGVKLTSYATVARLDGAKTYEIDISFPIYSDISIIQKYEDFLLAHPDVKLAVVDHITSPTSVVLPVKHITEVCHRYGVAVVIDGAHVPGQLKVDIQDIDADFYTGTLHKWLYCPRGCAFIWTNPKRHHTWFKPLVTSMFDKNTLHEAFAHEGTRDDTPFICATDGVDFYNRIGGIDKIVSYNSTLLSKGTSYLVKLWGTETLAIPKSMEAPCMRLLHLPFIPGFSDNLVTGALNVFEGKNFELKKLILDRFDVLTAITIVDGKLMIRLSANVYNTMDDFIKLGGAILTLTARKSTK